MEHFQEQLAKIGSRLATIIDEVFKLSGYKSQLMSVGDAEKALQDQELAMK